MKAILCIATAAAISTTPAAAQDIAGPVAAAVDQFGQSVAESMAGAPGVFVTAQGRAPLPAAAAAPMTLTVKGTGKTAVEAVADRNARLERIRSVANRFDVAMEVGETTYAIVETPSWLTSTAESPVVDYSDMDETEVVDAAAAAVMADDEAIAPTVTASTTVTLQRPNETRLPGFVDALVEAGVTDLNDSLTGLNLGPMQPFLSLLGLDTAGDPGEAVWNAATADGIARARAQAEAVAAASGRRLGPVRYVSMLMRSHDGEDALVSVAVRFGFE
ncbi:SIMPL domain-containing protein [Brevundimonas sp.]|uniref:SIMPL domain-containing protein n=1 Tax=Brevundimonas sp. TaxID=1871086 RepID=UPI002737BE7D|nr:SIMPL domain-containing protein [Brevundimonas sp.]MDP3801418.1 SIMPL domain-containing protein [Brevundimonas sp.]